MSSVPGNQNLLNGKFCAFQYFPLHGSNPSTFGRWTMKAMGTELEFVVEITYWMEVLGVGEAVVR